MQNVGQNHLDYGDVPIVVDGRAAAVIVIPKEVFQGVVYAAEEFRHHVKKATGVELAIVREDSVPEDPAVRIYLGVTQAAEAIGLDAEQFNRDAYRIVTCRHETSCWGAMGKGTHCKNSGTGRHPVWNLSYTG